MMTFQLAQILSVLPEMEIMLHISYLIADMELCSYLYAGTGLQLQLFEFSASSTSQANVNVNDRAFKMSRKKTNNCKSVNLT